MSTSIQSHRNHTRIPQSRVQTPDSPRPSTSRSNTPNRTQNRSFEPEPRGQMESPTPTPRRRVRTKRGTRKADQREQSAPDTTAEQEPSSEDELMNLLGVGPALKEEASTSTAAVTLPEGSALKGGVLAVTKEDIVASNKGRRGGKANQTDGLERHPSDTAKRNTPKKKGPKKATVVEKGFDPPQQAERSDEVPDNRRQPAKSAVLSEKTKRPLHDRRNRDDSGTMSDSGLVPFGMSALSQSLPSRDTGLLDRQLKNGKSSAKDNAPEWDMPVATAPGAQELTWQQKLQGSIPNSGKGSRPSSDRKAKRPPSAFNQSATPGTHQSRPPHQRRASADNVSVQLPPQSAPPYRSSGFDDDIPYHIGFNVHRAPQTPAKGAITTVSANTPLPIIPGEFPRINKANKAFDNVLGPRSASGSSLKYAGPTAHSSPHAASLAKPDLDDF